MSSAIAPRRDAEAVERFACFGGTCEVRVAAGERAHAAARGARAQLLEWHDRFTRFSPASELSHFNADPREEVPASDLLVALATAVAAAGARTGGLADGMLAHAVEAAGYGTAPLRRLPLDLALRLAPPRAPASPSAARNWSRLAIGPHSVRRPPGVALDSGGLAKGLFADLIAATLASHDEFVVNCCGDLRVGGAEPRPVQVASPFGGEIMHTFRVAAGAAATSGIGRRSWLTADGRPAHHLLDPSTGRPAYTGVVQATALAPTAVEAEMLAKAAVLSGPDGAGRWLPHGGLIVLDDRTARVIVPR